MHANELLIRDLIASGISRYRISKVTGIGDNTLSDLWNGKTKMENIKFINAHKLTVFAEDNIVEILEKIK